MCYNIGMRQILFILAILLLIPACGKNSAESAPEAGKDASEAAQVDVRMEEARKSLMEAAKGGERGGGV